MLAYFEIRKFATVIFMPLVTLILLIMFCGHRVLECLHPGGVASNIQVHEDVRWILLLQPIRN